ncbi:MAG: hypothetical protein Q7U36_01125 [bacterium]|nr:hypothetical protein [bacterium]
MKIVHRHDGLLFKPRSQIQGAFLNFLEEELIGKEFESVESLEQALKKWPKFPARQGIIPTDAFKQVYLDGDKLLCPGGLGGPLVIGYVEY